MVQATAMAGDKSVSAEDEKTQPVKIIAVKISR